MDVGEEALGLGIQTNVTRGEEIPVATLNACSRIPGKCGHGDHDISARELPLGSHD